MEEERAIYINNRIIEIKPQIAALEQDVCDILAQLSEARQDRKDGIETSRKWKEQALWAMRQKKKDLIILKAELKALNIERMAPNPDKDKRQSALDNRFADVFMNVAKENLPRETYNELRRITKQRIEKSDG